MDLLELLTPPPRSAFDPVAWAMAQGRAPSTDAGWSQVPEDARTTWNDPWADPSGPAGDEGAGPRLTSLNGFIAVHAGVESWKHAWRQAHPGDHVSLERLALDLLEAMNALVADPQGTLDRFDGFQAFWDHLATRSPDDVRRAWKQAHWLTFPQPSNPPSDAPSPTFNWRLAWVNRWLDVENDRRSPLPVTLQERRWDWVNSWTRNDQLTVHDLVNHHYGNTPGASVTAGSLGWSLAARQGSLRTLEAWTRWERAVHGEAIVERQWTLALDALIEQPAQVTPVASGENGLDQAQSFAHPGPARMWIDWGLHRMAGGDPSPLNRPVTHIVEATAQAPRALTLGAWAAGSEPVSGLPDPNERSALWWAARLWERADLIRAMDAIEVAPSDHRARTRL